MYTAKIKSAKEEMSLPDNSSYMDIGFDILLDGEVVAERRLAFPLGTTEEEITGEVSKYCQMFENDNALAAKASEQSEAKAASQKVLEGLVGKEVGGGEE